jgi:hypothetical protein
MIQARLLDVDIRFSGTKGVMNLNRAACRSGGSGIAAANLSRRRAGSMTMHRNYLRARWLRGRLLAEH